MPPTIMATASSILAPVRFASWEAPLKRVKSIGETEPRLLRVQGALGVGKTSFAEFVSIENGGAPIYDLRAERTPAPFLQEELRLNADRLVILDNVTAPIRQALWSKVSPYVARGPKILAIDAPEESPRFWDEKAITLLPLSIGETLQLATSYSTSAGWQSESLYLMTAGMPWLVRLFARNYDTWPIQNGIKAYLRGRYPEQVFHDILMTAHQTRDAQAERRARHLPAWTGYVDAKNYDRIRASLVQDTLDTIASR